MSRRVPVATRRGRPRGGVRCRYMVDLEGPGYSPEEVEWLHALQAAKLAGRPMLDWCAVLAVAKSLGYALTAAPSEEGRLLLRHARAAG